MKASKFNLPSVLLLLCLNRAFVFTGCAATTNVSYGSYYFSPSTVQIHVGDTVVWTNGTGTHTVEGTGTDPICNGNYLPCSHTFNTAGTYPYECILTYHALYGMTGTVIVVAANPPPSPAVLTNAVVQNNGNFSFTVLTKANQTNIVQATSHLSSSTNWISLRTNVPTANVWTFTDTNAGPPALRFYRVVEPH